MEVISTSSTNFGCRVCRLTTFKQVNDADNTRISVDTFRRITNNYTSTTEEIEEIINSLYELSILAYSFNNNNE